MILSTRFGTVSPTGSDRVSVDSRAASCVTLMLTLTFDVLFKDGRQIEINDKEKREKSRHPPQPDLTLKAPRIPGKDAWQHCHHRLTTSIERDIAVFERIRAPKAPCLARTASRT